MAGRTGTPTGTTTTSGTTHGMPATTANKMKVNKMTPGVKTPGPKRLGERAGQMAAIGEATADAISDLEMIPRKGTT